MDIAVIDLRLRDAEALQNEAAELYTLGNLEECCTKLNEVAALYEAAVPNSEKLALFYQTLSYFYLRAYSLKETSLLPNRTAALNYFDKAVTVLECCGDEHLLCLGLINQGVVMSTLGDNEAALTKMTRGLNIARSLPIEDNDRVCAWTRTATVLLRMGKFDEADEVIEEGFRLFHEIVELDVYFWALKTTCEEYRELRSH